MIRNLIKNSFNELFEQRQLPSSTAKHRMLQFPKKPQKKKINFVPAIITVLLFIGVGIGILLNEKATMNNIVTPPQDIIHYSLEVNGQSVPLNGKIEVKREHLSEGKVDVRIVQRLPEDQTIYKSEEMEDAFLSKDVFTHLTPDNYYTWQKFGAGSGLTSIFGYTNSYLKPGEVATLKISEELKERLAMLTDTIEIHLMEVEFPPQATENTELKIVIENYLQDYYQVHNTSFVHDIKIAENIAYVNFKNEFVNYISPTLSSFTSGEVVNTLNRLLFEADEIESIYYFIDGDVNAWWNLFGFLKDPMERKNITDFETAFSVLDGEHYLYGITIQDTKSDVIQKLGIDHIEYTNPEIGGHHVYFTSILEYKSLNLSIHFNEDKVVSIFMNHVNENVFEKMFDSYSGGKYLYESSINDYSENNAKHLYSKDTLQMVTAKFDPYRNLTVSISLATPEFIQNIENGIYE